MPTLVDDLIRSRMATIDDVPALVRMGQMFLATSQYRQYIGDDPAFCTAAMVGLLTMPGRTIFVSERRGEIIGMLGVIVFVQPFSGEFVATEVFWWLNPAHRGYGGFLLRRAERWARACGATRMTMMAPIDAPRVAETYVGLGYTAIETVFSKNLAETPHVRD
jgi:GNAT superfamily N-acetyltransferase